MINKVTLIGRLGMDPEIRHLEGGVAVGRFSLATNEAYKDKDGNLQESTEWHNIVVWRDLADRAEKTLKKGGLVYVEGKISYRKYTGQDGQERTVTDIVANTFRNLSPKEGGAGGGSENRFPSADSAPYSTSRGALATETSATPQTEMAPAGADDLPF